MQNVRQHSILKYPALIALVVTLIAPSLTIQAGTTDDRHSTVSGSTYYVAGNGSDSNPGTPSLPWKSFSHAARQLRAGDVLVVKDGTYTEPMSIDCGSSHRNGTSSQTITVRAETERAALLRNNGTYSSLAVRNCSYWNFTGLRAQGQANSSGGNNHNIHVADSSNLTFKRLLVSHTNRYTNSHGMLITRSSRILVEESEFYFFHRHAIDVKHTDRSTFRRVYGNSRGYGEVKGGYRTHNAERGDDLITFYPGSHNVVENCISENNNRAITIPALSTAENNKVFGTISLNDASQPFITNARGSTTETTPRNNLFENVVAVNSGAMGVYSRSSRGTVVKNATVISADRGIVADRRSSHPGDGDYSITVENTLVRSSSGAGIQITNDIQTWEVRYNNSYVNSPNYSPSSIGSDPTNLSIDLLLGSCYLWIPDESPMKGKGKNGADIGANIIYRYEDGKLTDRLLWSPGFPCGSVVPGINDVAGSSCFDIHERLNAGVNGCPIPSGSSTTPSKPSRPANLRIVSSQ